MDEEEEFKLIVGNFKCLKGWKIQLTEDMRKARVNSTFVNGKGKKAWVSRWSGEGERPFDYYFHEVLHCVFEELRSMDRRRIRKVLEVEEDIIREICGVAWLLKERDTGK
jgi:hypothetical protein